MKIMLKKLKSKLWILLIVLAFGLRILYLRSNLFFGYEQARDLFDLEKILTGDLRLTGPPTDIEGVYHGAFYLYVLLPLFVAFNGDPFLIQAALVLINSLAVIFLYSAVRSYYGNKTAVLTSLIYVISYSSIIYARWLSNTTLIPAAVILLFWSLVKSKQNWRYLLMSAIFTGSVFQFHEVAGVSLIIPVILFVILERVKLNARRVFLLAMVALSTISSYIIFEVKNDFTQLKVLKGYILGGGAGSNGLSFVFEFIQETVDTLYPESPKIAFLVFLVLLVVMVRKFNSKKELLAVLFLTGPVITFGLLGIVPLRHFYIAVPVFLALVSALVISKLVEGKHKLLGYLLLGFIMYSNTNVFFQRIPSNQPSFIYHAQRTYLQDLKNVVDWVYARADGRPFSYDYYSIPYWKEEVWEYMFEWYGKPKYGYTPTYDRTKVFFTLIEPNETIPVHLDNWYGEYKKELDLLDTYRSGKLKAEMRSEKIKEYETEK